MFRGAILFWLTATLLAQGPVNLDFPESDSEGRITGWVSSPGASFSVARMEDCHVPGAEDSRCALVRHEKNPRERYWVARTFDARALRGKQIRYRAAVRVEALGQAQLFVRVDRPAGVGLLEYSGREKNRSRDWTVREIVGTVDGDAERITVGLTFVGIGSVYFAEPELEVVED